MIGLLVLATLTLLLGFVLVTMTRFREARVFRMFGVAAVSVVLGFFFMVPLGMLFDAMNWPLFHTWALAHGSFLVAWPILALLSFAGLLSVRAGRKSL